ncbi:MAG: TetR family transcriptional regulator [Novosphingobium sp.]|nr:TetR family transcriptional regulator [Novosphingobium sp.]
MGMDETKLDKRQIVMEARKLLLEDGIGKLSMRKLASRLDIRAPTLYWYFPDRAAILREMILEMLREAVERVPSCDSWEEWLYEFGLSIWHTNSNTPFAPLLLQSNELNDVSVIDAATATLRERSLQFNVDETVFLRAHSDINALTAGYSVFHHAQMSKSLSAFLDMDQAVDEGIRMIVDYWSLKAKMISQ